MPEPIPLAALTDDRLRSATLIRVADPSDPGFVAWVPVGPDPDPGRSCRGMLVVAVDPGDRDGQLAALRRRVAALRPPGPG